ncbi:hypothetical protein GWK47_033290 [Chionoecetes opilio]|uniref:C-type lectin domain-containing protein n=1 Tax=Chionoecetes opilio TaxID=41210 RepID=A0A8J4YPQ3_CHIOP|nr:hypothetical protein GWK47_033290 [Chionoecetes opilio]
MSRGYDGFCYTLLQEGKRYTWNEAREQCKSEGKDLGSPLDMAMFSAMFKVARGKFWVGATDMEGTKWYFLDGRPVHCSCFAQQPPQPSNHAPRCGLKNAIDKYNPHILAAPCNEKHSAVCAMPFTPK